MITVHSQGAGLKKIRVVDYSKTDAAKTVEAYAAGRKPDTEAMRSAIELLSPENRWSQVVSYVEWNDFRAEYARRSKESVAA